jgi:hypothetical protein
MGDECNAWGQRLGGPRRVAEWCGVVMCVRGPRGNATRWQCGEAAWWRGGKAAGTGYCVARLLPRRDEGDRPVVEGAVQGGLERRQDDQGREARGEGRGATGGARGPRDEKGNPARRWSRTAKRIGRI